MNGELEKRVVHFVSEMTCIPEESIQLKHQLMQDFGLDGDDASEFFKAFHEKFSVDVSGLVMASHFGEEGPYLPIISTLRDVFKGKRKFIPISVADLIHAVRAGSLSTTDLPSSDNGRGI